MLDLILKTFISYLRLQVWFWRRKPVTPFKIENHKFKNGKGNNKVKLNPIYRKDDINNHHLLGLKKKKKKTTA